MAPVARFVASQAMKEISKAAQQSVVLVPLSPGPLLEIPHCQKIRGNRSALRRHVDARRKVLFLNPVIKIHGRGDDP